MIEFYKGYEFHTFFYIFFFIVEASNTYKGSYEEEDQFAWSFNRWKGALKQTPAP